LIALALGLLCARQCDALEVQVTQNTERIMPYQVFELTFQHEGKYDDPTWDVTIDVTFIAPDGERYTVGGFFYGSSKPQEPVIHRWKDGQGRERSEATWPCEPADLWKARYAPSQVGPWRLEYVFANHRGEQARGEGKFTVVEGRTQSKGWVRINPQNPFRFVFEDGTPYFPVGWQDGVFDGNNNGSAMDQKSMEGPFRTDDAQNRPKPPPGAMFVRGPSMNPQNGDVYFGRHSRAGFNLWRFSPHNFSLPVFELAADAHNPRPGTVRWEQAAMVDEMLRLTRKYGVHNYYGIFGFAKVFNDHPEDEQRMAKVRRLVKYSVDRWGAYVDFWELLNEQKASDEWYRIVIPYLKSIDPYHKPIATSWERPDLEGIDISAPHWYGREDELSSDAASASQAANHKRAGKPVVFGEQGNGGGRPELIPEGITGVWDPGSARRMRVRCWSALFNEISFVFWETSYAKDGHSMNIWLGPEERQYVKALQDFASGLDAQVKPAKVALEGESAAKVRAYGLRSDRCAAVYLHHVACDQCATAAHSGLHVEHRWDHRRGEVRGLRIVVDVPRAARAYWYSPADASIVARLDLAAGRSAPGEQFLPSPLAGEGSGVRGQSGQVTHLLADGRLAPGEQTLSVPPFEIDLALLVTPNGPPDSDRDGQPNDRDADDDNDGCPDAKDAFPLEREEQADVDGDRIGDSLDADIDADGVADDLNRNGVPDNEETDWDNDGVPNASAVPWDAFPRDPKEWRDTDGDGLGDNADADDDGDGYSDAEEARAHTDPLDPVSFPATR